MSDDALEDLRREAARVPEDAATRLRLATALARVGARDDAVESALLAGALGADRAAVQPLLASLGAPASPWSHLVSGDAARTGAAPVRGPRRGEVVARAPLDPPDAGGAALLADGTVLLASERTLRAFDGRTLAPRGEWRLADDPVGDVVALADGRALVATTSGLSIFPAGEALLREPALVAVRPDGRAVVAASRHVEVRGPELELQVALPLELNPDERLTGVAVAGDHAAVLVQGPLARGARRGRGFQRLALDGEPAVVMRYTSLVPGLSGYAAGPVLGPSGRLLLVFTDVDPHGREAGHVLFTQEEPLLPPDDVPLGARSQLLGSAPPPAPLVLVHDRSTRLVLDDELLALDAAGAPRWRREGWSAWWIRGLVGDREGVVYAPTRAGLAAWAPDGEQVLFVPAPLRPLAIDARGRLLAVRADERGAHELVAIA